jgi:uncharacterized membrane protein
MSRTNQIGVYVSDADQSRLEREADEAEMTVSSYIMSIVRNQWTSEDTEEAAKEARVEERVERMTSEATDEMAAMIEQQQQRTEQMADMAARSAVYSIANFELLKLTQKPPEAARTKSLQIGSRRLRDPFDPDADVNVDLAIETDDGPEQAEQEEESPGLDDDFFKKHS